MREEWQEVLVLQLAVGRARPTKMGGTAFTLVHNLHHGGKLDTWPVCEEPRASTKSFAQLSRVQC